MGIPAWVWFAIAAVAIGAGAALLLMDRRRRASSNRERRRWAALRGWQFAETDNVLPTRWQHGAIAYYGRGLARDVVAGSTFTADGRRQVYVLDLDNGGKINAVLAGVRCRRPLSATVELWLPNVPVPRDSGLDLLGPVGSRYAFVTDLAAARPLVTPDLVDAVEEISEDVSVVWLENDWVMAAATPDFDPAQLERLLRDLGEVADLLDPAETEDDRATETAREPREQADDAPEVDEAGDTDSERQESDKYEQPTQIAERSQR